jgi:hypothetical protein
MDEHSPVTFGDVQLARLPTDKRSDGAVIGQAVAEGLGNLRVRFGAHLCPPTSEPATAARVLGAKLGIEGEEQVLTATAGTEVFWVR